MLKKKRKDVKKNSLVSTFPPYLIELPDQTQNVTVMDQTSLTHGGDQKSKINKLNAADNVGTTNYGAKGKGKGYNGSDSHSQSSDGVKGKIIP